ncbi:hypothetical protein MAPG_03535 [Magnaporthiopsis poae ATCC 64411]|uniref:Uncharacterized protein n=1 Tax=Magnaporthiopsis poae (strain ATCC 64411 / 73-15) TaxID=644358 RepID=A0A0C4DU98_MAGP6|nr:hypothetical protein MAPG_03535 [Magnaporthiopsis poae ATCC 64411]
MATIGRQPRYRLSRFKATAANDPEIDGSPKFEWDDDLHDIAESLRVIAEDCDGGDNLFHDQFILRKITRSRRPTNTWSSSPFQ